MRQAWPRQTGDIEVTIVLFAIVFILGVTLGWLAAGGHPYCPTEDSCVVDYRDGAWHIVEVTP